MKIPKIIHLMWFGGGNPPAPESDWVAKWSELNPRWTVKMWVDSGLELVCGSESIQSEHAQSVSGLSPVNKSEMWRLEVLRQQGGLYVDVDIEPLRPVDSILDGVDAALTRVWGVVPHVSSAFMASVSGHAWMEDLCRGFTPNSVNPSVSKYIDEVTRKHPEVCVLDRRFVVQSPISARLKNYSSDAVAAHHFLSTFPRTQNG